MNLRLKLLLCVLCASLGHPVRAQPANAPLLPLTELQPGMTGEVWTVFKGSTPEPFTVQVTGILRNALGPGKSMILCELTDSRVQLMGAVAGMSGSPLYIGGKLAGVLSYQIQHFETVRYAGFTPIGDMIEVETRRGIVQAILRADREVADGMVFMPFCFNESPANKLTNPMLDPFGKIPEFKYCAARVAPLKRPIKAAE